MTTVAAGDYVTAVSDPDVKGVCTVRGEEREGRERRAREKSEREGGRGKGEGAREKGGGGLRGGESERKRK